MLMEIVPDADNVHYIDEYPELQKRVWLRRLAESRLAEQSFTTTIIYLPETPPPDGVA